MGKIEKLLDKTKRDGEAKKGVVYVATALSILLIVMSCIGIYYLADVDKYLNESKDIIHLYDFYDSVKLNDTAVFFVGSSIVGCAIYPSEIEKALQERGYDNISVYNLKIEGCTPLERSAQIQNIIDVNPSLVVFGESYLMVADDGWTQENFYLVHDRLKIRNDSLYLYTNNEIDDFMMEPSLWENKRFILSALQHAPRIENDSSFDYFGDTYTTYHRINEENKKDPSGILAEIESGSWAPEIPSEDTRAKEALIYNSQTLMDAGISVVIVNMPLHPGMSEKVSTQSRQNYFDLLNQTGANWIDLEYEFPDDKYWYKDAHHLAPYTGAKDFAPLMADLIIQELG